MSSQFDHTPDCPPGPEKHLHLNGVPKPEIVKMVLFACPICGTVKLLGPQAWRFCNVCPIPTPTMIELPVVVNVAKEER